MAQHNYLIDGLSGTGKSSVCLELIKRGYNAIDADQEFAYLRRPGKVSKSDKWIPEAWDWDTTKLTKLLQDKDDRVIFICGGATNQDDFARYFDKVLTLTINNDTMKQRLLNRPTNSYKERPHELAYQLEKNKTSKTETVGDNSVFIDAMQPLDTVVEEVLKAANLKYMS